MNWSMFFGAFLGSTVGTVVLLHLNALLTAYWHKRQDRRR